MKNLIDILEKLDLDKTNVSSNFDDFIMGFPFGKKANEVAEYLENSGFKKIDYKYAKDKDFQDVIDAFNSSRGLVYIYDENYNWVEFANITNKKAPKGDPIFEYRKFSRDRKGLFSIIPDIVKFAGKIRQKNVQMEKEEWIRELKLYLNI